MEVTQLAEDGKPAEARNLAQRFRDEMLEEEKARLARQKAPSGVVTAEWDRQQKSQLDSVRLALDYQLGRGLFLGKALDEAGGWARRMMEESPEAMEGALLLAEVQRVKGNLKEACELYKAVLARRPNLPMAANNLAWVLAVDLKEPEQAYAVVQQLRASAAGGKQISGDRLDPDLLDTMGVVYQKLGGKDRAAEMLKVFDAASQRYPRDPRMWLYLGEAYAGLEDKEQADRMFQRAMKLAAPDVKGTLSAARQAQVLKSAREAQARLKLKATSR
jgi:tetratricopeptide (TPR) repeat protein